MKLVTLRSMTSIVALLLLVLFPLVVMADSLLVAFNGGIGVDPESGTNAVCGVTPPGAPWTIRALQAVVQTDGQISVVGNGLLLAGGNVIGSNGGQVVRAQLFCNNTGAGCGPGSSTSSTGVALEANGDFLITDTLSPSPPSTCTNPVLLITQAAAGGHWFAAGIPLIKR
jgi:hypothetical protein